MVNSKNQVRKGPGRPDSVPWAHYLSNLAPAKHPHGPGLFLVLLLWARAVPQRGCAGPAVAPCFAAILRAGVTAPKILLCAEAFQLFSSKVTPFLDLISACSNKPSPSNCCNCSSLLAGRELREGCELLWIGFFSSQRRLVTSLFCQLLPDAKFLWTPALCMLLLLESVQDGTWQQVCFSLAAAQHCTPVGVLRWAWRGTRHCSWRTVHTFRSLFTLLHPIFR